MPFQKLSISPTGRHIIQADGTPFFYLADTAWELFHRLNREDAVMYLEERARTGYTAIQTVAMAEFDGMETPNAYGRHPLSKNAQGLWDASSPDVEGENSYWAHVDFIISEAGKRGLYIALLPTWGINITKAAETVQRYLTAKTPSDTGRFWANGMRTRPTSSGC